MTDPRPTPPDLTRCETCGWMVDTPAHELGCQGYPRPTPPDLRDCSLHGSRTCNCPRPTPPERMPTDELAARARRAADWRRPDVNIRVDQADLLTALADRLEQVERERAEVLEANRNLGVEVAEAEARLAALAADRETVDAGLRRIEWMPAYASWDEVIQAARELLERT